MNVLLIFPSDPVEIYEHGMPLLGQAYLAAGLEKNGHNVVILDMTVRRHRERFVDTLHNSRPDIVGVTLTALSMKKGYRLIERIKRETSAIVVAGGPHVTLVPERILLNPLIDFIFMGEGDISFATFVSKLEKGEIIQDTPGLGFKVNGKAVLNPRTYIEDLDSLPFPAWHLFNLEDYYEKSRVRRLPILTSRGCPFKCIYCTQPIAGGKYRVRSPKNIVDEIEHIVKTFNVRMFDVVDDSFIVFPKRVLEFCDAIMSRGLNIKWEAGGINARFVSYQLFDKMRQAGCFSVAIGAESCNDNVLKLIRKPATRQQIEHAIRVSKKVGFFTKVFFMCGLPGSTYEIEMENIKFFKKLDVDMASYANSVVYPKTDLYKWVKQNAIPLVGLDTAAENFSQSVPLTQLITKLSPEKLAYFQPLYEDEAFPRQQRAKALMKSCVEAVQWQFKKALQREFGKNLGLLGYYIAQIRPLKWMTRWALHKMYAKRKSNI